MKNYIRNWNFVRALRLLIGIFIIVQSIYLEQWLLTGVGVLYSLLPLFNISTCGVGSCGVPSRKNN